MFPRPRKAVKAVGERGVGDVAVALAKRRTAEVTRGDEVAAEATELTVSVPLHQAPFQHVPMFLPGVSKISRSCSSCDHQCPQDQGGQSHSRRRWASSEPHAEGLAIVGAHVEPRLFGPHDLSANKSAAFTTAAALCSIASSAAGVRASTAIGSCSSHKARLASSCTSWGAS